MNFYLGKQKQNLFCLGQPKIYITIDMCLTVPEGVHGNDKAMLAEHGSVKTMLVINESGRELLLK